jgi:hypothetical protein
MGGAWEQRTCGHGRRADMRGGSGGACMAPWGGAMLSRLAALGGSLVSPQGAGLWGPAMGCAQAPIVTPWSIWGSLRVRAGRGLHLRLLHPPGRAGALPQNSSQRSQQQPAGLAPSTGPRPGSTPAGSQAPGDPSSSTCASAGMYPWASRSGRIVHSTACTIRHPWAE